MDARRFSGSTGGDNLVARYEELRVRALGGENTTGPEQGFVLFLRHGMAAWMNAWSEYVVGRTYETFGDGTPLPVEARSEVAMILTGMALGAVRMPGDAVTSVERDGKWHSAAVCREVTL